MTTPSSFTENRSNPNTPEEGLCLVGVTGGIAQAVLMYWCKTPEAFPPYRHIALWGRRSEALEPLKQMIQKQHPSCELHLVTQCLTELEASQACMTQLLKASPQVRWQCVLSAGVCPPLGLWTEQSLQVSSETFMLNTLGVSALVHACLSYWQQTETSGDILVLNSTAGLVSEPYWANYSASKHALKALIEALAKELHPESRVRLMSLHPGAVRTEMWPLEDVAALTAWDILSPEDVAHTIAWMLSVPHHITVSQVTLQATQAKL
jgi:short-subunit dehydrogenase